MLNCSISATWPSPISCLGRICNVYTWVIGKRNANTVPSKFMPHNIEKPTWGLPRETSIYFFYLICWRRGTRSRRRSAKCIIEHWTSITNLALILFQISILWNFWANPVKLWKILHCPPSKGCRSKQKENHWLRKGLYFILNYLFLFRKQGGKWNSSTPGNITDSLAHSLP